MTKKSRKTVSHGKSWLINAYCTEVYKATNINPKSIDEEERYVKRFVFDKSKEIYYTAAYKLQILEPLQSVSDFIEQQVEKYFEETNAPQNIIQASKAISRYLYVSAIEACVKNKSIPNLFEDNNYKITFN
jgi:hypothetical protein